MLRPPPKIRGLDFSEEELQAAKRDDRLLVLGLFTRNACNLRCAFCYTGVVKRNEGALSTEDKLSLVDQAIDLGARTVYVAGAGEPLMDTGFWPLAEHVRKRGLDLVVYTNNTMVTRPVAERLKALEVSVFAKYCSPDPEVEARIVGVPASLAGRVWAGREILLDVYAPSAAPDCDESGRSAKRLGIECVITRQNVGQIASLWRWARQYQVVPFMELLIDFSARPHSKIVVYDDVRITDDEADALFGEVLKIDETEFGYTWAPQRPFVAINCHRLDYNLVVDHDGFAFPCSQDGWKELNVRDLPLSAIWKHSGLVTIRTDPELRRVKCGSCPNLPPVEFERRFKPLFQTHRNLSCSTQETRS